MTPTVTDAVFAEVGDWARPLLTYYDDQTGERTELSAATLGNWAAKTANYLVDELGVAPGDEVRVDLPEHWQTAAILLGTWWAGAHVRIGAGDGSTAETVVFTSRTRIDDHPDADELVVAGLDPFALPLRDLPPGVADYASAVRVHGDQYRPRGAGTEVLDNATATAVHDAAATAAQAAGITSGARVLSTREWHTGPGIVAHLLAPLLAGASLVHVSAPDPTTLDARGTTEKATVVRT